MWLGLGLRRLLVERLAYNLESLNEICVYSLLMQLVFLALAGLASTEMSIHLKTLHRYMFHDSKTQLSSAPSFLNICSPVRGSSVRHVIPGVGSHVFRPVLIGPGLGILIPCASTLLPCSPTLTSAPLFAPVMFIFPASPLNPAAPPAAPVFSAAERSASSSCLVVSGVKSS